MKIRSITYFCNPGWPLKDEKLQAAGAFLAESRSAYEAAGFEVQTTRLATIPFPMLLGDKEIDQAPELARKMSRLLPEVGISYAALGPALPGHPSSYAVIPEAISVSKDIFFSAVMADNRKGISLAAVQACARIIVDCAPIIPNGFANLQFAALANVKPGAPFFPAAYWDDEEPAFAIATEAADLAVAAFMDSPTVAEGRRVLINSLEEHANRMEKVADFLKYKFMLKPLGIDFSLAPYPADSRSLGTAVEYMGVPKIGLHGSLAAAAVLTEGVEAAGFQHAGFSGFMMPVLEDSLLARRAAEGVLTVKDALLYSAVCGTGLDTIPLPGDVTAGQIAPVLLDLSALALRLDKPLTARLMPVPGKKAGEPTGFDFEFFANSRVMGLDSEPLNGPFSGTEVFPLGSRPMKK